MICRFHDGCVGAQRIIEKSMSELTVWILHRDVDYEFGNVIGVYSSEEKAEEERRKILQDSRYKGDPEEYNVQRHEVE